MNIRALHPGDLETCIGFAQRLTPQDVRLRFGRQLDLRDRDVASQYLLASGREGAHSLAAFDTRGAMLGIGHVIGTGRHSAELALLVRSDAQRRGIGARLLDTICRQAADLGYGELVALVEPGRAPLIRMLSRIGFAITPEAAEGGVRMALMVLARTLS